MKVFNYYKTVNKSKNHPKPFLYHENYKILRSYKDCFVLYGGVSEYLVYDGIIVAEYVKISDQFIDIFMGPASENYHYYIRPWKAYKKAKELLK